ncbi:ribosomal protein S18-alanine N-acetyltransferase [Fibrobacter sp. UWB10]|jgi:ribosomal-protein-alanine N-acetyltransferase|uniref:ribosomal protein S18-alanine N-acetyltransferase n=1 Tax=Fibrobacter sp. UWB10 TaxID=1896201 RepID=UPI00156BC2E8|nr:ribosomal protein S18-alanine N-acetyltransferase [Fibrobacter sp. UWB10]SMP51759.1 ribosomal-protein-alanine N-acetyltransferase [Fibrobacter sp. UWB10]
MSIRKMNSADIPAVLRIQGELAFQDWNERQYEQEIKAPYTYAVVYENEGAIEGYAVFHLLGADSELLSIAVSETAQRKGIGTQLLHAGLSQLDLDKSDCCFLEVRENNIKARNFYEKHGFNLFGIRKKYYADGENAALYRTEGAQIG